MTKTIIIKKEYKIESGADLTGADFTGAYFRGIKYDSNTKYDEGSNLDLYIKNLESKLDE